jgi:hydroxyethylthiazole kinase
MEDGMQISEIETRAAAALETLHKTRPLVHHITNYVVMNDTANITLHLGGSPVMAHAKEEVEEMSAMADALVLNPGTLEPAWIEAMVLAGKRAGQRGTPVVLDPVGAGATEFRTRANQRLLDEVRPAIVRGNGGEIGALAGAGGEIKGVDSVGELDQPEKVARQAAQRWGCTVAITGKRDRVSDGERVFGVDNGHAWLTTLTGTGCMATTVVAAFAAVEPDRLVAATAGLACFGFAAELAARSAEGPGSFKLLLFDSVFNLSPERLRQGMRVVDLGTEG